MTSVRETSQEAFDALKQAGVLSAQRWDVYSWLYTHGPATSGEFMAWKGAQTGRSMVMDQSRAIFTHLRERCLIKEVGTRACRITGKRCIEWDVTSAKAPTVPRRRTSKQKLQEAHKRIEQLEAHIEALESDGILCPGCYMSGEIKAIPRTALETARQQDRDLSCATCGSRVRLGKAPSSE